MTYFSGVATLYGIHRSTYARGIRAQAMMTKRWPTGIGNIAEIVWSLTRLAGHPYYAAHAHGNETIHAITACGIATGTGKLRKDASLNGTQVRLGRLFNRGSGRSFVAAIDHGVTLGVPQGAERIVDAIERVIAGEPDAILISPGMLQQAGHLFAFRGAPAAIVRADFIINHPFVNDLGEQHRVLVSPSAAAAIGADAVILFLMVGAATGEMFADNVEAVARAAHEAHQVGLPLIVEAVLWGSRVPDKRDPDMLAYGCRVAAELGADALKTEYTGDPISMAKVIEGCPAPVLVLGGPKTDAPNALFDATREALDAGARGVAYGRNIWQADDPLAVSRKLREIIHGVRSPALAVPIA
jgi:DhnA family fructose-bisphosphate aldolase class Ia